MRPKFTNTLVLSLSLIAVAFSATSAQAEAKIAVVNLQQILQTSKAGKIAQKEFEEEAKGAQGEVDTKVKRLEKLQEEFKSQQASLSESALVEKREKLIELGKDLERSRQDLKESLQRKNQQLVNQLLKDVRGIIEDLGKKKEYSVILERGAQNLLYVDGTVDITADVVKLYDAKKS